MFEAEVKSSTLYVVATPIGNLRDITLRALDILAKADCVAAEDTRTTGILLKHHGIATKLFSLHRHNERERAQQLIARLAAGESVALVSDAGTPGISDPGAVVVNEVRRAGYTIVPIPGASALTAALSASGMEVLPFCFHGFLPTKSSARKTYLEQLQAHVGTLIFYEAPHRITETVADLAAVLGAERDILIARELTKLFETLHCCTLGEASAWLSADANRLRGEFVLVVSGAAPAANDDDAELERILKLMLAEELSVKQAAKLGAAIAGVGKNLAYERALALKHSNG